MSNEPAAGNIDKQLPPQLRAAFAAHRAGDLVSAEPLYRRFIEKNADHPTALQLYGLLHSQRGDYPTAIQLMQKSLQLFPEQAEVANNLGNALRRYGRLDDAIDSYARAIELYPDYVEAIRNKGNCYLAQAAHDDAEACFRQALDLSPDDVATLFSLGCVFQARRDYEAAIPHFERAVELKPDYAEAHHNLGLSHRMKFRPQQAKRHYDKAQQLGLDNAKLYHNLGNVLIDELDLDGAIDAYREALRRDPTDLESHQNLNTLLWQQEMDDVYLESYRSAIADNPRALQLRLAYAIALNQKGEYDKAESVLREGLRHSGESADLRTLLGLSFEGRELWHEALDEHAAAVRGAAVTSDHRVNYARALLACARPEEALEQAQQGAALLPFNQRALAYLGLCWRLLDDPRDHMLNDYDNMVQVYEVPVVSDYGDTQSFNQRLAAVLNELHIGTRHPPEQTLRGGSQTYGDLFARHEPEIVALVSGIQRCVEDYIARLPHHAEHPLLVRRSDQYDFSASWSVRLASCGYHEMHVHPMGWISSAYYVEVPDEVSSEASDQGGIKFGEPDIDIGEQGKARRLIKPTTGRLVLFPSYMWHGTIPFESSEPRMTVAFDVVPGKPVET